MGQKTILTQAKLTTAKMDLKYDQASTKNIEMKEILIRGGQLSYKSIKHVVSAILTATVFFLYFSDLLPHGGSLALYTSFWAILTLHLLII